MVRVHPTTTDKITAWRVRDALACHPLLGGATAQISVTAGRESVVLDGWTLDDRLVQEAQRLARRVAGRRVVQIQLQTTRCMDC